MQALPDLGPQRQTFYYDLGSPDCYLVAEQLRGEAVWEPVLAAQLRRPADEVDRAAIERRALELGIQPLRWPAVWPPDSRLAMLAATYAKRIGRGVAFSLAAFRQAYAGGADLGSIETIMLAGAASELHPTALLKGIGLRTTAADLTEATDRARRRGVTQVPTVGP